LDVFVRKWTATYQLDLSPIKSAHALAVVGLPDHHKDPFDRILIAQATVEGMRLVSGDSKFALYGVPILW
jgi:PIN domain nuclease of toxin-antitoxin system